MAAARGAVALRKSPARAVRAVSSTVCDDEETTGIFFSSVGALEGRDRLARGTRADPDRSTIIHRDRSIVDRGEGVDRVASHRVVSIDARDDENEARRRARR